MAWNLLRIKGKGLTHCTGSIMPDHLAWYHAYHDDNTGEEDEGDRGVDDSSNQMVEGGYAESSG